MTIFVTLGLASCFGKTSRFDALQENVIWEDSEGLFSIVVQGRHSSLGVTTISVSGEKTKTLVYFDAVYGFLNFTNADGEKVLLSKYQAENGSIALKDLKNGNRTGNNLYDRNDVVLRARPLKDEEADAKFFTFGIWENIEKSFSISVLETGYYHDVLASSKKCSIKGEEMDFNFLGEKCFSITFGDSMYAYGSYMSYLNGDFELAIEEGIGKEYLGRSLYLKCRQ